MTEIGLAEWQKICDNPEAEIRALRKRVVKFLEDSQYITDHYRYHFVRMTWSHLNTMLQELAINTTDPDDGRSDYGNGKAEGFRQAYLPIIRAVREQLDALDVKLPGIKEGEHQLRNVVAREIRAELVCCDIYQRIQDGYTAGPGYAEGAATERRIRASADYHAICHWGEFAARIAENPDDLS